jgi:AraC-like DNA-binding protein
MVAELEKIDFDERGGFRASFVSDLGGIWHFHPEYELVLNLKSYGTRIIGDNVELFDRYAMTLVSGLLPHSWNHYKNSEGLLTDHSIVCHFRRESLGESLLLQHEMKQVSDLLDDAERGIAFSEADARGVEPFLRAMTTQTGTDKMVSFFNILNILSSTEKRRVLCSVNYKRAQDQRGNNRMTDVYSFIRINYSRPITLNEAASVANMSPFAFSRFFKKNCGAGLVEYINQVRTNRACYLLKETDIHIHEIASECGFQSISNFNKHFRKATTIAPREYRALYRE